jgi:hypothetical protein
LDTLQYPDGIIYPSQLNGGMSLGAFVKHIDLFCNVSRLDCGGYVIQFPAGTGDFSLLHNILTGCRSHPTSFSVGNGVSFFWGKGEK